MYSPLCAANVPWSFGSLLFCSFSLRWLPAPCILPWCPFLDAFCTLSIYPSMFFSLYVNTCSRSRTSLHVAVLFWRFQPPDALYMLSRLYRKVNPFRSDLLYYYYSDREWLWVQNEHTNHKMFCGARERENLLSDGAVGWWDDDNAEHPSMQPMCNQSGKEKRKRSC
jgi:hypothetical protein